MSKNNQELGQAEANTQDPLDFEFLAAQTFGDKALQIDVLRLFLAQSARLVPALPALGAQEQADAAHLLKGSARGIGAWPAAAIADLFEGAAAADRPAVFGEVVTVFEAARGAITAYLQRLGG